MISFEPLFTEQRVLEDRLHAGLPSGVRLNSRIPSQLLALLFMLY